MHTVMDAYLLMLICICSYQEHVSLVSLCEACCVVELCVMFVCVLSITPCKVVERWVVCYCTVSDISGYSMMIYTHIITGWTDCTDVGFSGMAHGVCHGAIG